MRDVREFNAILFLSRARATCMDSGTSANDQTAATFVAATATATANETGPVAGGRLALSGFRTPEAALTGNRTPPIDLLQSTNC